MYAAPSEGHDIMIKAIDAITASKSDDIDDKIVIGDFNDYP